MFGYDIISIEFRFNTADFCIYVFCLLSLTGLRWVLFIQRTLMFVLWCTDPDLAIF